MAEIIKIVCPLLMLFARSATGCWVVRLVSWCEEDSQYCRPGHGCDGAAAGEVFVLLPRVVITGVGLERADYRQ